MAGFTGWRLLGSGGFADVYRATDQSGRSVAVKCARAASHHGRFDREARVMRELRPPTAPALIDHGVLPDGLPYLVMELVPGVVLDRRPPSTGPGDVIALGERVAVAVDDLHARGVVHRDIKPANVIVRTSGVATLLDFGLARLDGDPADRIEPDVSLTTTGMRLGTVLYMSPEQCRGQVADARADLYSFAVLMYELLVGRTPFEGGRADVEEGHVARTPPSPSSATGLPLAVDAVFERALAKAPAERFSTARSFTSALREAVSVAPSSSAQGDRSASRQPVFLAGLETTLPIPQVAEVAAVRDGMVARIASGCVIVAFPHAPTLRIAATHAVAVADAAEARRRAFHVADLRLRHGKRGTRITGAALDDVAGWWPSDCDDLVYATDEATPYVGDASAAPAVDASNIELRGRDELLSRLEEFRASCFLAERPGLATVVGGPGSGKSRIAQATSAQASATCIALAGNDRASRVLADAVGIDPATLVAGSRGAAASRQYASRALGTALLRCARRAPTCVVLDDADRADYVVLDALEFATMEAEDAQLCVIVVADPRLRLQRPHWGHRAASHVELDVLELDESSCKRVLIDLLSPVDYLPADTASQILDITGGVPLQMVELVAALRATGAVRRQPGASSWIVSASELMHSSPTPLSTRLGREAVALLSDDLRELAEVCACFLGPFDGATVRAVRRRLGVGPRSIDAGIGLARLASRGLLRREDDGLFAMRSSLRRAVEADLEESRRRDIHAALYRHELDTAVDAYRLAQHALSAGMRDVAARAYLDLAEQCAREFRYVEAEQYYATALHQLRDDQQELRLRGLRKRCAMRHSLGRHEEAMADLEAGIALATELDDQHALGDLVLTKSTLLDFIPAVAESASAARAARRIVEPLGDEGLLVRCALAEGRTAARAGNFREAVSTLEAVVADAKRLGDDETHILALIILNVSLLFSDRSRDAEQSFEETIELCGLLGDRFHLSVAYGNRVLLWVRRGDLLRARRDAEKAVELAREVGHFLLEWRAYYNLAELVLWIGDCGAARDLIEQAIALLERFAMADARAYVMAARIDAADGRLESAREALARARPLPAYADLSPIEQLVVSGVALACDPDASEQTWRQVMGAADEQAVEQEHLEVRYLCVVSALRGGRVAMALKVARDTVQLPETPPAWKDRFERLIVDADGGGR